MSTAANNNTLQQISSGQVKKKSVEELSYIFVGPKMRNAYLRGLVEQYREEKKMTETQIVDALLSIDELIETEKLTNLDFK